MEKKSILIAMHYLELGGAENALIGLLQSLDYSRVDVTLFLHSQRGEMLRHIPREVKLLPEIPAYAVIEAPLTEALRRRQFGVAFGRLLARIRHSRYLSRLQHQSPSATEIRNFDCSIHSYVARHVSPHLPVIDKREYDIAVSFLTPHDYVLSKVHARKKICWIHTDYSRVAVNAPLELPVWSAYDNIVSISPGVTGAFLQTFPSLRDKIVEIGNILPASIIRRLADEVTIPVTDIDSHRVSLLSIGRFSHAKNFDSIPDIARRLRDTHGLTDFRWDIIGYGSDRELILDRISEAGVEDCVRVLGKRTNPYPYIKACDLYVQPSRYEGRCVTVQEARLLGKPVIVSDYPTAPAQVEDGVDGLILPLDNALFAEGLAKAILNKDITDTLARNIAARDYSDRSEIDKFYSLIAN